MINYHGKVQCNHRNLRLDSYEYARKLIVLNTANLWHNNLEIRILKFTTIKERKRERNVNNCEHLFVIMCVGGLVGRGEVNAQSPH
jgi:hypothetical protein